MNSDDKIVARLQELVSLGERVLQTRRSPGQNVVGDLRVNSELAHQWATSTLSLLDRVFGKSSSHYLRFDKATSKTLRHSPVVHAMGTLLDNGLEPRQSGRKR